MSRLIDKLTRIHQNEPQPIGFAALGRGAGEKSRMQVIACLKADDVDKFSEVLNSVDAVLIEINRVDDISALEKACEKNKKIPAGGWLKAVNAETLKKAARVACDFEVFPGTAPLTLTQKENIGRVLEVDVSMNERLIRAAGDLAIDAVLVPDNKEANFLNINRALYFRHLINSVNKPVLVFVSSNIDEAELQSLWDIGMSGVIVELSDDKSSKNIVELRKTVASLAPPAFRKKFKASATIPRIPSETAAMQKEEGDGEEDE